MANRSVITLRQYYEPIRRSGVCSELATSKHFGGIFHTMWLNSRRESISDPEADGGGGRPLGVGLDLSTPPTPLPAGDEARDGWTFFIITPDGLAAMQPGSLCFDALNLAGKSEGQIASVSLATHCCLHLEEPHSLDIVEGRGLAPSSTNTDQDAF